MTLRNAFEDLSTEATQEDVKTAVQSMDAKSPALVGGAVPVTISGIATDTKQDTGNASLASIDTKTSAQATAAKQDTGNTSLASLDTKTPALSGGAVPVVLASTPLPSGAATAAKQPALGIAGTASSDVISVQGIASMTALKVDGSAVTQPVSAASLPLPTGAATAALQGALTETAPASDTASSGLNGRLQRLAQRITSLIALTPTLGTAATAASTPVNIASDDAQFGAKTSGSSMSSGGSGFIGWLSDLVTQAKAGIALFTATAYADTNRLPVDERDGFSVSGTATSAAVLFTQDLLGYNGISVQVTSAGTTCTITYECSDDNTTWYSTAGIASAAIQGTGGASQPTISSNSLTLNVFSKRARYFRARVSTYTSGTVSVVGTLHKAPGLALAGVTGSVIVQGTVAHGAAVAGSPVRASARALSANYTAVTTGQNADLVTTLVGSLIEKPYSIPEADWHYAAPTAGILSNTTTAVTVAAAAGSGLRNYITSIDISTDAFGAASVLAIRDGAAGTVIWSMKISTAGLTAGRLVTFPSPLKSTANTLLEIVTITANTSGLVFPNVHGYIAP